MERVQRVRVWSGGLRLAHWLIALAVLVLLATGWLIGLAPSLAADASDAHGLAGFVLTLGLALRLYLLVAGSGAARWRALVPAPGDLAKAGMMLRFYLSLGRTPLPRWYAHNPLWVPLYALILLILVAQSATGLLMTHWPLLAGFYLPAVHAFFAPVVLAFSALHVAAVVLHDARGTSADVSAMINGHRIFVIEKPETPAQAGIQSIPVGQIGKRRGAPD